MPYTFTRVPRGSRCLYFCTRVAVRASPETTTCESKAGGTRLLALILSSSAPNTEGTSHSLRTSAGGELTISRSRNTSGTKTKLRPEHSKPPLCGQSSCKKYGAVLPRLLRMGTTSTSIPGALRPRTQSQGPLLADPCCLM